jgi:pimeloyl-ACP methyl ester carboxylesterase
VIPWVQFGSAAGAGADGGAAKRMLFAHSLIGNGLGAEPFLTPLLDDGWQVVAVDQRGHGSAPPVASAAEAALAEYAADLLAVLDEAGWDTAWLAGGSMGAGTALAAAARAPERVEGLALMAPAFGRTPNAGAAMFGRIAGAFENGMDAGVAAWRQVLGVTGAPVESLDAHELELRKLDPASLAIILRTVMGWTMDAEFDVLGQLDVPVLVLAWEGDDIHPMAVAEEIAGLAKHGQVHVVPDGDPFALFRSLAALLHPSS